MNKVGYLLISLIPICINIFVLRITSIITAIVGVYVDMYSDSGNISLVNADISKIVKESFSTTNMTGLVIGSCIAILIFIMWIQHIRKKENSALKFNFSIVVVLFAFAIVCQTILYVVLGTNRLSDINIFMFVLFIFLTAISVQLLCRGLTMYYAYNVSERFWLVNVIQAIFIASIQYSILQGICSFVLGLLMGLLFNKARKSRVQKFTVNA